MKENRIIIGGYYRHYRGSEYVVLAVGRNSENPDEEIGGLSRPIRRSKIRPSPDLDPAKKMFLEKVIINGKKIPRFRLLK